VVGGAALLLRGLIERPTRDVAVVAVAEADGEPRPRFELPQELREAVADVAADLSIPDADWLNAGAVSLIGDRLPPGYSDRLQSLVFDALIVSVFGRQDLIHLKLYAASDEGPGSYHTQDLVALSPTEGELDDARRWIIRYTNQHPAMVADILEFLRGVGPR
jgi:hypothetical protein